MWSTKVGLFLALAPHLCCRVRL